MNKGFLRSKRPGQSIPLIALIIVVLFAMVGLAVDVGNTYAEQRSAVRASEAATIAGMSTLLETNSDDSVEQAILSSLKSNKINVADYQNGVGQTSDNRVMSAQYLKSDGNPLCYVGSCGGGDLNQASYIQVKIDGFTNTYFARVVGQQTLPVHAQSFAGKCSPTTGVYPIAIDSSYLDQDRLKPPSDPDEMKYYGVYKDENYRQGKFQRRLYLKDAVDSSGGFGYVRWTSDNSTGSKTYTADGLTGDGNLDLGFEEAPWPTGTSLGAKPDGYPLRPGQLNSADGDWIYANTGIMSGLEPQFDALIKNRTRMLLPIINGQAGNGSNAEYHVERLGAFILRGYGNEPSKNKYFDLVYVGDVSAVACNITNIVTTTNLGLTGTVFIRPRYTLPPVAHQPVEYTVVLDTSGSMNWNFNGEAKVGSTIVQCGSSNDPARNAKRDADASKCNSVPKWSPSSERRIAVAKTALQNFVDLLEPYDAMQIIGFSADDNSGGGVGASTTDWQYGSAAGKQVLKDAVLSAGANPSTPYDVSGGTPSATGLNKARDLIIKSPDKSAYDGRDFKKVVIFLTDGVANYFLKTNNSADGFGWSNDSHDNPSCSSNPRASEDPDCQVGRTNTKNKIERPITAMATEAGEIKKLNDGNTQIYVIALAGVSATGLATDVASQSSFPYYSEAVQASQVQQIFDAINQSVENPACIPAGGTNWLGSIDNTHTVTNQAERTGKFGLPADTSVYGYVYLKNQYGQTLQTVPVTHQNGQLSYSFADVAPGTYKLEAFVAYKGDDAPNPVSRVYSSILFPNLTHNTSRTFNVSPSQTLNSIVPLDPLYLDLSGLVCP
jgi:Flp pilus assembly protein TadG